MVFKGALGLEGYSHEYGVMKRGRLFELGRIEEEWGFNCFGLRGLGCILWPC